LGSVRADGRNGWFRFAAAQLEHVTVTVVSSGSGTAQWEDIEWYEAARSEGDESVTLEQIQEALAKIPGSLTADFIDERDER
jgi:hypothetical protein